MRYDAAFEATNLLETAVATLDPDVLDGASAQQLVEVFSKAERIAAAGKALAAGRVASSGSWRSSGHRSAAHWVAQKTGVAVGSAVGVLQTASALSELPELDEAVRSGKLSEAQAKEVASAAAAAPEAAGELLELAGKEPLNGLRSRCASVKAAALPDEAERYAGIRSKRRIRHWSDPDGTFRADIATTPDAGAAWLAALEPIVRQLDKEARAQGRRESYEALRADALLVMAKHSRDCGEAPETKGPGALVHVMVDSSALERGCTAPGERCEIAGVGPVPVATAQALATDSIIAALAMKGEKVDSIAHLGRTINAKLRTSLEARGRCCEVPGCGATFGLEIDHELARHEGGQTKDANLGWLCGFHHYLKTYRGYRLIGPPGARVWTNAPDPPDTG